VDEPEPEAQGQRRARDDERKREADQAEERRHLARPFRPLREPAEDPGHHGSAQEQERARDMQREKPLEGRHGCEAYALGLDARERHLKLLTDTIEAVNSTLDLEEVLSQVATKVADALRADACFVYLYDGRSSELVLRATHGTRVEEMTQRPRMRPGEGITGSAAEDRKPVMIAAEANLDPRFKNFPNLPEDEYESILAVPILARGVRLEGALNIRTRRPRNFTEDEIELLLAIAAQVAQSIEHAKLYEEAQRRVHELEALARISEAVSEALYLEESLEAIVKTTMDALSATGAALVLEDGAIAWPEGRADTHAIRQPLRWRGRQIGELVADRATPFNQHDQELLGSIAQQAAVALEHGRAVMRGVLAQEIHHRVKNNLQTVASLLRLQARDAANVDPRKALDDSVNRILAIAAVHEVLTEQRDEDVDLADLLGRLRAMLVQDVGAAGHEVTAELESITLAGHRATALALVFSELLGNAFEHGGAHVEVSLHGQNGDVVLTIADDGAGIPVEPMRGTGLSIVRALVRDELGGTLELRGDAGTRAEVRFPA
jgi:two-component system, sensor histidine kinase PdtaS